MPNRILTSAELELARALLNDIRERIAVLAHGDVDLLFAYRRKISKELVYDERSGPMARRKLKAQSAKNNSGYVHFAKGCCRKNTLS